MAEHPLRYRAPRVRALLYMAGSMTRGITQGLYEFPSAEGNLRLRTKFNRRTHQVYTRPARYMEKGSRSHKQTTIRRPPPRPNDYPYIRKGYRYMGRKQTHVRMPARMQWERQGYAPVREGPNQTYITRSKRTGPQLTTAQRRQAARKRRRVKGRFA